MIEGASGGGVAIGLKEEYEEEVKDVIMNELRAMGRSETIT